jgi:Skp family chaperone for outer membrane proteins
MYNKLLKAAYFSYNAQKAEAIANLEVLFNKSVGIGEHTDLLTEIKKWTESLSQAEENMQSLKNNFDEHGNPITGEEK